MGRSSGPCREHLPWGPSPPAATVRTEGGGGSEGGEGGETVTAAAALPLLAVTGGPLQSARSTQWSAQGGGTAGGTAVDVSGGTAEEEEGPSEVAVSDASFLVLELPRCSNTMRVCGGDCVWQCRVCDRR